MGLMRLMLAESTSEPEVAEPSFVPFRGAAQRLDGKAPSPSTGPPAPSTSAGLLLLHTTSALFKYENLQCFQTTGFNSASVI